ncbi:protein unc-13 homolog [Phragmites australis]|uniref:protein unc-13 homolog n=1 Tax=Phragmites australis TaxID=29695 RepID=UPI002D771711|nr:protein unc-13 homolog [Phragmites australis]
MVEEGNVTFSLEFEHGLISEQADLEKHVVGFYKTLFGSNNDNHIHIKENFWSMEHQIEDRERESLIKEITEDEMKGVAFNMKLYTTFDPNGFGVSFFINFWDVIKRDVIDMVRDFQKGSLDLKRLNYGVITLLPKVADEINIKQFRPICLLNVDHRLFTKMMIGRISSLADQLIKQQQTTFFKGRNILEGVVILHEVVHELKHSKRQGVILKIDFEKAYEKVKWNFVHEVLERKGLPDLWIKWVMQSVQGGQELIDKAVDKGLITGVVNHLLPKGVSHIQYVDDTVVMIDGSDQSTLNLKDETDSDIHVESADLDCPFGRVDALRPVELRETAYEIFFMSCRSLGGPEGEVSSSVAEAGPRGGAGGSVLGSRIKKALGLRVRRLSSGAQPMMGRTLSQTSGPASPGHARRPMTSAEIMQQQMLVTDQSNARLSCTLMRAVVGQVERKAETIILPLELLRQLKPVEFADAEEYHQWQFRQIKLLEASLILHPSLPLDRLHSVVLLFCEVMRATKIRFTDTGKNSDAMRALTNTVHALAWRSSGTGGAAATEVCHWANGYSVNVLLYVSLLQTIFDLRECTVVLDEVDELLELIKKTWPTLGINRIVHNVCFAWVFFQQYVITGQVEPDLAAAALAVLVDVAVDAKQGSRDPVYGKVLLSALGMMLEWSEKRLLDYHDSYEKGIGGAATERMEILLSLVLAAGKIVADWEGASEGNFAGDRVDHYIRCWMKSAFTKILKDGLGDTDSVIIDRDNDPGVVLMQLSRDTEQLAMFERRNFSPVLRRWHPAPVAIVAVTLHGCFGIVLRQYLAKVTILTKELVCVLHSASRLEKALAQMTAEDAVDCDDGRAKAVVGDMEPYEVEVVVMGLLKTWMDDKLMLGRDCLLRAKDTESWVPKSKEESFAASVMELTKLARATVDEFSEIPASAKDEVVQDLVDGLESIFVDYISFVASCGSKQSYLPPLPPLTRCNQDSGFFRLWKKAVLPSCQAPQGSPLGGGGSHHIPRPSISRGTQRLYVRLNMLHYVLTHVQAIDKSLSSSASAVHFDHARAAAQSAISSVAEVAAHRLIFLDSRHLFYQGLYAGSIADARIRPALRALKQNMLFLVSVLDDRAQPLAVREVMRASFEAFLMVLLTGGNERSFVRVDHTTVEEDFRSLNRAFCTCGEGLVPKEVVVREAETTESVVELMARSTDCLIDAFGVTTCESIGAREDGGGGDTPVPPTTRQWDLADPNTILRVLCHHDDEVANQFLKRTFQLARRR